VGVWGLDPALAPACQWGLLVVTPNSPSTRQYWRAATLGTPSINGEACAFAHLSRVEALVFVIPCLDAIDHTTALLHTHPLTHRLTNRAMGKSWPSGRPSMNMRRAPRVDPYAAGRDVAGTSRSTMHMSYTRRVALCRGQTSTYPDVFFAGNLPGCWLLNSQ
jgi:hypothetical protein